MAMSTMEHLFMQILDRKQWIEGQIKHQIESYEESLAYNILADGKQPPPWLWSTETDSCGYPNPNELNAEQLYSRMLFPLPTTTTPSAINSTYFNLPAMSNKVCESIKSMETCASKKYFFTENRYPAVPTASKLNPDMVAETEIVEPCAVLDPFARFQHPVCRQKGQEICVGEQDKSFNHLGDMITQEEYAGRFIQSRARPVKADNTGESSAMNDNTHNIDGDGITRSRLRSAAQTGSHQSFDKLSEPVKPSNCIETGVYQGGQIQTATPLFPTVHLNHLSCTGNGSVSNVCTTRTAAMELGLDTAFHVNSGLISNSVESLLPETFPMVERKKLLVDVIEDHGLNKICYISSKKNQLSLENVAQQEVILPVNKDCLDRELEEVDDSEKDVPKHGVEVGERVSDYGAEQDGQQLFESEASESHSVHTLGHRSSRQDANRKRSTGSRADEQHNKKLEEVLMMEVDHTPLEIYSLVEAKHPAFDSYKNSGLGINSVAMLEETKQCSSDIVFNNLKVSQGKEAFSGAYFSAHVSLTSSQLQEDTLLDVEVAREAEEANMFLGTVLKDSQGSSKALEQDTIFLPEFRNRNLDIPATSYLKVISGSSHINPTCSSPDADCTSNSNVDLLGHIISIPVGSKKGSIRTPIQCPAEEESREILIKGTNGRSFPLSNIVQNSGSAKTSQPGKVLVAEIAAEVVAKCILQSPLLPTAAGTHDTILEFHSNLRNSSSCGDKNSGSCKSNSSSLSSSDNTAVYIHPKSPGRGCTIGIKECSVADILHTAGTNSSVPYSLRRSTNSIENHGSYLLNGSEENFLLPETNKSEISVCPADATVKTVDRCLITPNGPEAQGGPTQERYYLRSRSNHDMNVASSRSSKSNSSSCLRRAKDTNPQACGWITPNSTETLGEPTQARYCLRSHSNHDKNVASSYLKQVEETVPQACEISSPKSRKVDYRSSYIFTTSPRINCSQSIRDRSDCRSEIEAGSRLEDHPISISAEMETGILDIALEAPSKYLHRNKKRGTIEGCSYLKETSNTMHTQEELLCDTSNRKSQSCFKDETKMSEATTSKCQKHYNLDNCQYSLRETSRSLPNYDEFTKDRELCDSEMSLHMHDDASSPHCDAGQTYFDEMMPEFEGFSIDLPSLMGDDLISSDSNLPTLAKERASMIEQLYKSSNVLTPVSCTSSKYKVHKVPDVYQSLPAGLLEHINLSSLLHINDADLGQLRESEKGHLALQSDGSFVRTYSYSMPSSTGVDRESWNPPLTPQVVKFGQKVVSGRSDASSEKVGSNPELICFRIDENSSIENGNDVELAFSKEDVSLRENDELTYRKALADITAECENGPSFMSESMKFINRESLESVNLESYFRSEMSAHSSLRKGYADSKSKIGEKENSDFTVNKKLRKAALSLRNRSSRTRMSGKINERSRSHGNLETGCRPNNMVSNISSFVPLVRQKQQATVPLKGRKDIKIKALEAAEAAKRLEVKKQNEREMRKAAAKLEREKAEQENIRRLELMQKQKEEEKKIKEADIAARKRLREEEGRKVKDRKRRCIEETRRQKIKQEGRSLAEKVEKKVQHKTSLGDEKKRRKKEQVEEAKRKWKSEKSRDFQHQGERELQRNSIMLLPVEDRKGSTNFEASKVCQKSNGVQKMVIKSDDLQELLQTGNSINEETQNLQSYEMSPYKDSDDEDGEEEIRREKKFIPFWARRDYLHQLILSKQHLDPAKIFCRKRSFILSEVLQTRILQRPV